MSTKITTLILGGMGVKGVANIGALRSLREHNVGVERIVASGTSALIAAQFALGRDLESLTDYFVQFFVKNQWHLWGLAQLSGLRAYKAKRMLSNFSYFLRGVHFAKDNISRISSLSWNGLDTNLKEVFGNVKNSDLQIPLSISCIDLTMGKEVSLQKEDLFDRLKAAIAFPGLFTPVSIGNHEMVSSSLYCEWPLSELKESWRPFTVIDIPSPLSAEAPESATEILADIDRMRRAAIKEKLMQTVDQTIRLDSLKRSWDSYKQIPELISLAYENMNANLYHEQKIFSSINENLLKTCHQQEIAFKPRTLVNC